ncbi:Intracellular serine protease [Diaporthe amygdali]|uniref:Intracellular serine protease n=1 Tax=Phomopsis amygdali TaxID=1214568 RepID=UPI0022FF08D8|nr:Intracellular serine protease [Diaporthe amygdali]KAJ0108959.1 Intracellular serine protease [Diaporthe amygdali]
MFASYKMPRSDKKAGITLVQAAFDTIFDIARFHTTHADNGELLTFYANLMAYCLLISGHLSRITGAGRSLACDLADSITMRLGEILVSKGSIEDGLRELRVGWGEVRDRDSMIRAQFTGSTLAFGDCYDKRAALIHFLASWESDVRRRYPEERFLETSEDATPHQKISEPSFSVWNSAQAMFKAMTACQKCGCIPEHDYGARLCLGTYRKSGADDDTEGKVEFDMFLSLTHDWQEVRVHTAKERAIKFAIDEQAPPRQPRTTSPPQAINQLCVPIIRAKKLRTVELKVTKGKLLWLPSELSKRLVDLTKSPVSLYEFLQDGRCAFNDKTWRILAVLLSYAVLHLQDTPWLQPTWSSSDILFFRTEDSKIPLEPFLQTRLFKTEAPGLKFDKQAHSDPCGAEDEFDCDDIDPDKILQHPCPTIVTLAIMLMEVYFGMPLDTIARQHNVKTAGDASFLSRYMDACKVSEDRRNEMPDLFASAVEKCLDRPTWEDTGGTRLDSHTLRTRLYKEVVRPLEINLTWGYRSISIDNLDRDAREYFCNWDTAITHQPAQERNYRKHWEYPVSRGRTLGPLDKLSSPAAPESGSTSFSHHPLSSVLPPARDRLNGIKGSNESSAMPGTSHRSFSNLADEVEYKLARFFDDEAAEGGPSREARVNYSRWKENYQAVYDKFIPASEDPAPSTPRVRIAVLDTGIDLGHPDIQACNENIKAKYNCLNERLDSNVHDLDGHGTFVTSLLLDYAPNADIYIVKIADRKPANPRVIAGAIYHAVDDWNVDLITMSFGFPTRAIDGYDKLELAIKYACYRDVLLFAAASNSGGQRGRAYPAREANVVCVHSTDARGNRSPFSPTASPQDVNLATVGEAVNSAWPVDLCIGNRHATSEEGEDAMYSMDKSGTSYATPIMVGIAAFLLLYVRLSLPDSAHMLKSRSRMVALLQRIAQKGQGSGLRDGYYFVDVSLHTDSLFGKDKAFLDRTIEDILNN